MLQHSFECISHAGLLASAATHTTIALPSSLSLSLSLAHSQIHRCTLTFYSILHVCPKCIYTNTLYGLFTNVATAMYHYYYYYYRNNNRSFKQSTLCFRLFDCRLFPNSRFFLCLRLLALLGPNSQLLIIFDGQVLLNSRLLSLEGPIPNILTDSFPQGPV